MARLVQKLIENRRRQHAVVTAHKRKTRDEVNPQLRAAKRAWSDSSKEKNLNMKCNWHSQRTRVQRLQREQKRLHMMKILAHKRRLKAKIAGRDSGRRD